MNFFSLWHQYFESNKNHFDHLDWLHIYDLTVKEKDIISSSIQQFQRGEHSEGKHFLKFAKNMKDDSYVETIKIFIKEEQDHAAVLGQFMDTQQIKRLGKDWLDNTFRWLRKLAGLECTITVLLTAEIISMIYYKALKQCTNSKVLKQICKQILIDEEMHLRFQCFSLSVLYKRKSFPSVLFSRITRKILMTGTIIMVWFYHKRVLKMGDYNFFSYFKSVWQEFKKCDKMIKHTEQVSVPISSSINNAA